MNPQHDLTSKQARFIEEYLIDLNATQTAIRAGYSPRCAKEIGHENLTKPHIAEAIRAGQEKLSKRAQITQEDVLAGLKKEATAHGPRSSHSARVTAWVWIGKHLGMFSEQVGAASKPGVARIEVVAAKKRPAAESASRNGEGREHGHRARPT